MREDFLVFSEDILLTGTKKCDILLVTEVTAMSILLITLETISQVAQSVCIKLFGRKCKSGDVVFTAMMSLFAFIFFLMIALFTGAGYAVEVLPYSIGFAIAYSFSTLMYILAFGCGSLGITSLILSYSLVIPTLYGLIFWGESLSEIQIAGIAALVISLFMVREKADEKKKAATFKWILYMVVAFIANGACAVIQREQQLRFLETYDTGFMTAALAIAAVIMFLAAFITERRSIKEAVRNGWGLSLVSGATNGSANLIIMITLGLGIMEAAQFYPVIAASQTILTFIVSIIMFGERFILRQWIGFAFGTVALVLMNM